MTDEPTDDRLLAGRVRLRQPRAGLRAGLDAVLLAAAVPASPGDQVLEAGCGTGAAFLCLAARVPELTIFAVEREGELAALATENAAANGLGARAKVLHADIREAGLPAGFPRMAHAFANPPYWPSGTPSPNAMRARAMHEDTNLEAWTRFLAAPLAVGGSLTLILPAARLPEGLSALSAVGCGSLRVIPLWPRAALPAKRIIVQGLKGKRGPARIEPGLILHEGAGFSAPALSLLRDAGKL